MNIIIVGAGASGLSAAISLKRKHPKFNITLLERKDKIGSKILASGNGKCNIGNSNLDKKYYNNEEFYNKHLSLMYKDYLEFLSYNNIYIKELTENRMYPFSESSKSVYQALKYMLDKLNINVIYNTCIVNFKQKNNKIYVYDSNNNEFICDKLILSTGGTTYKELGCDNTILNLLKNKNVNVTKLRPSLTGFILKDKISDLFGLRLKCKASLLDKNNNKEIVSEVGEVIFKKDGISGIAIMNLSFYMNKLNIDVHKIKLALDLFYDNNDDLLKMFNNSNNSLIGIIDEKLIKHYNLKKDLKSINLLKNLTFEIDDVYGFDYAHVTSGGIDLNEIKNNFEFKKYPNVYAIGEVLNIDGLCGGYNLYNAICNGIKVGELSFEDINN